MLLSISLRFDTYLMAAKNAGEKERKSQNLILLRADVSKNQTLAGNSQKIDFAHTFKFDTLSC